MQLQKIFSTIVAMAVGRSVFGRVIEGSLVGSSVATLPCVPVLYTVGLSAIFWNRNPFFWAVWAARSSKEIVNQETLPRDSKSYFVVAVTTVLEHF